MEEFYTARTIKNKIGLPIEQVEKHCVPHYRESDGKKVYSIAEARKVKAIYLAGKAAAIAKRRTRINAGLCGRKLPGNQFCPKARVKGYAYCEMHLPPSVKRIRKTAK